VHYGAQNAFLYYNECGCFSVRGRDGAKLWAVTPLAGGRDLSAPSVESHSRAVMVGRLANTLEQERDLRRLLGRRRVWFMYSHVAAWQENDVRRRLLRQLDQMGKRVKVISAVGARVYLYKLRTSFG
jgi:hypothetical protein